MRHCISRSLPRAPWEHRREWASPVHFLNEPQISGSHESSRLNRHGMVDGGRVPTYRFETYSVSFSNLGKSQSQLSDQLTWMCCTSIVTKPDR